MLLIFINNSRYVIIVIILCVYTFIIRMVYIVYIYGQYIEYWMILIKYLSLLYMISFPLCIKISNEIIVNHFSVLLFLWTSQKMKKMLKKI